MIEPESSNPAQAIDSATRSVREPKAAARARVVLSMEHEVPGGWAWEVTVEHQGGEMTVHTVMLSWLDHDYWCGGASAPSRVAQAIVEYVLANREQPLPEKFDVARARRWLPRIDRDLRERL
jgi:hypothetical protein